MQLDHKPCRRGSKSQYLPEFPTKASLLSHTNPLSPQQELRYLSYLDGQEVLCHLCALLDHQTRGVHLAQHPQEVLLGLEKINGQVKIQFLQTHQSQEINPST